MPTYFLRSKHRTYVPAWTRILLSSLMIAAFSDHHARAQLGPLLMQLPKNHCSQILGAPNSRNLACQVWDGDPDFTHIYKIEIYRSGQLAQTIEPGSRIREWHFWRDGDQISLHFGQPGTYILYDALTGAKLETASEQLVSTKLPEWAKTQNERADEAVPEGPTYKLERTAWISKLLGALQTLHSGMKRKDLDALLTTEGGLSFRTQQTYVSRECIYIKVDVRFWPPRAGTPQFPVSPEDTIESISAPYLAWSVID